MLATIPKNHPLHRRKRGGKADDSVDDRETPDDVYVPLNEEFHFTLDVAAARHNAKCPRYFTLGANDTMAPSRQLSFFPETFIGDEQALAYDGLRQPWLRGEVIWCNPPFSDIGPWVEKATYCEATVVMLLPANRTEQPWWQEHIEPYRDAKRVLDDDPQTRFLAGRRCFKNRGLAITNRTSKNPPFGIVIIIWDRRTTHGARVERTAASAA